MNTININIEGDIRIILAGEIYGCVRNEDENDDICDDRMDDYDDNNDCRPESSDLSVYVEGLPEDIDPEITETIICAAEDALRELIEKTSAKKISAINKSI